MDDTLSNILFALFISGVLVLSVSLVFYYQNLKRRAFLDMAGQLGFRYYYRSFAIPRRFAFLRQQRRGRGRHAFNILFGRYQGADALVFDYQFNTGIGADKTWHFCSFAVMRHGTACPSFRMYPKAMLSVLGQIVGYEEVFFDGHEIENAFSVYATDENFARRICNVPFIEYMLRHPELSVEVEEDWIAVGLEDRLHPEEIPRRLRQVQKIHSMMPF